MSAARGRGVSQIGGDKALGRHAQGVERKEYGAAQGACAHGGEGYGGTHGGAGEHRQRSLSPLKSRGFAKRWLRPEAAHRGAKSSVRAASSTMPPTTGRSQSMGRS